MKRFALLALLLLAGCHDNPLPPPRGVPATPMRTPEATPAVPAARATWTVMLYLDADNDLEESEMDDLREILKVGSSKKVQLVTLVDRSNLGKEAEGYSDEPIANQKNWSTAKLFHIDKDKLDPLEDWGEVNMADGATLTRFLKRAQMLYPADKYALFILDHGEAWAGVCADDSASNAQDLLSPQELGKALQDAGFRGNQNSVGHPLQLLVLDACLMANLEMAMALEDRVDWLVASEEIIPLSGLNYTDILGALLRRPQMGPRDFGQRIVNGYLAGLSDPSSRGLTHLALVKIDGLASLTAALEKLAEKLKEKMVVDGHPSWLKIARARLYSEAYGRSETPLEPSAEVHDLGHLMERLEESYPDLSRPCRLVRRALKACVNRQVRGPDRPHARGLTVFFPPQSEWMKELASADYLELNHTALPNWTAFLQEFTRMEREKIARPTLAPVAATATTYRGAPDLLEYRTRLGIPEAIDTSYFVLVKDDFIVGQLPSYPAEDSTLLEDTFDGRWLALTQSSDPESPALLCPLSDSRSNTQSGGDASPDSEIVAAVPAQLQREDRAQWVEITLYVVVDVSSEELRGRVASLVRHSSRGPVPMELHARDKIRLLHGSAQPGGHPQPGESMVIEEPDKLTLQMVNVAPGAYRAGFQVTDLQGHKVTRTVPLEVSGENKATRTATPRP